MVTYSFHNPQKVHGHMLLCDLFKQVKLTHLFPPQAWKTHLGRGMLTCIRGHFLTSLGVAMKSVLVGDLTPGYGI